MPVTSIVLGVISVHQVGTQRLALRGGGLVTKPPISPPCESEKTSPEFTERKQKHAL